MARNFESEWSTGYWDYMRGLSHVSRYGLLASLACHERVRPSVLDVGCGEGTLFEHLGERVGAYCGFDSAASAIARARERYADPRARFEVASITDFEPGAKFDVILFNAILYLFGDKQPLVRRYAQMLAPGGIMVIENHTTFRDARQYFQKVGEMQDSSSGGWGSIHQVLPFDWLGPLFREYQHRAHFTLVNWSVERSKFPCRHVHVFGLRPRPDKAAQEDEYARAPAVDKGGRGGFTAESAPYLFGTESMGPVLDGLDVSGRSVLTVLGSADQLLNFWWAGAREVTGFDISRAASYVAELKMAMLRSLDRARFLSLLLEMQAGLSDAGKSTLGSLLPDLSPTAGAYFKRVIDQGGKFKVRTRNAGTLQKINPYLQSDEAYLRTRANLRDSLLLTADAFRVREKLERRFDYVYLANVLDFNRAKAPEAVERLWPLVEPAGAVLSYEFASHKQQDGEYGNVQVARKQFAGPIYGGTDSLATLRRHGAPQPDEDPEQARIEALARSGGLKLSPMKPAGAQSSHFFRASSNGEELVLRAPKDHTKIDVEASFRSHRLVRCLARRIGAGHVALPVALFDVPQEHREQVPWPRMIAMPFLSDWAAADAVPRDQRERIGESDRISGALLCVLTGQRDAAAKNVLMRKTTAEIVLLDLDTCLGRPVWWGGGTSRPCFLPGEKLAYQSAQQKVDDLPPRARELVCEVAGLDAAAASDRFGLLPVEAESLVAAAREVRDEGLSAAGDRRFPPKT